MVHNINSGDEERPGPAWLPATQAVTIPTADPAAIAAAESVKARISAGYIMAMQRPRNESQARQRILTACRRPLFAERVEYSKPVGRERIVGPSVRFAELALREWSNILTETQVIYEDDELRRIRLTVIDLETNASHGKEIQVRKTVERKSATGRDVVCERTNSYGDRVYVVRATDEELASKEAALVSKALRNEGLRLLPSDIIDEAIATARETLRDKDAEDPDAAKKRVLDSFATELRIMPKDIEQYLGHAIDTLTPPEVQDLRGMFRALRDGEAKWSDFVSPPEPTRQPARKSTKGRREAASDVGEWTGVVSNIAQKAGNRPDGTPWTLYVITGTDGETFSTFSKNVADEINNWGDARVEITYETTSKGSKNIVSYALASGNA